MDADFSPPEQKFALKRPARWRWARGLGYLSLIVALLCGGLFAAARFWVLPWIGVHPEWVAAELSKASGVPVSIGRLSVDWPGLRPRLSLGGVTMHTGERAVLRLERVEATMAWMSLLHWAPYFHRLEIVGPEIELGRGKDGVFTVAGIRIEPRDEQGGDPLAWLFGQTHVVVSGATLTWNDELRAAPMLRLEDARFTFERGIARHRFALEARPPVALATAFEVNGEVNHYDPAAPADIAGRLYVGLERADLGGWSAWVDYPFPCNGHGGVHLWLDSDGKGVRSASADVSLDGVEATLAPDLPVLRLSRLGGRLLVSRSPGGLGFGARSLWLDTADGKALYPMDFDLRLRYGADGAMAGGAFTASPLDLTALAGLASFLPLGEEVRAYLAGFDPRGRMRELAFDWEGGANELRIWSLKADFENLGLVAYDLAPGMDGISGSVEGDRESGRFTLSGRDAHVDLPRVFENSLLAFANLDAKGGWSRKSGSLEVTLNGVDFANDDAAGSVSGRYWPAQVGPGEIDLTGELTRADGGAVWRYIPRVAGQHAYDWVKGSIRQGRLSDVRLQLKGPLRDFPFRNGEGKFSVAFKVADGKLDYAAGWPVVEDLAGGLSFDGPGLTIEARRGRIFETRVDPVRVEISDLQAGVLVLEGVAQGPSANFLRFIAESPLAARLHGFPGPLRAEGDGRLDLNLMIPLHDLVATEVSGDYRFAGNRIHLGDSGMTLESAEGGARFTGESVNIPAIRGRLFGAPFTLEGKTGATELELSARGQFEATAARKALNWPLLGWLGGVTDWRAEFAFGRGGNRIAVQSGLRGLYSRLPAPFAKETDDVLPLQVEAVFAVDKPQQLTVKMGGWFDVLLERDAGGEVRGGVGLNQPAMLAKTGVDVAASLDMLDVDAWQWSLDEGSKAASEGEGAVLPLASVVLDVKRLRASGRTFRNLKLRAQADAGGWKANLESVEAQGKIDWRRAGEGMLSARLRRLELANDEGNSESGAAPPRQLPGLDIQAEQFVVAGHELGRLEVQASNRHGGWLLDNFVIQRPETQLTGSGIWLPGRRHSKLDFTLSTSNVGEFAGVMGYAKMVRGGQAKLVGQLAWDGTPTGIDYPTLSGYLDLNAKDGRFERIEPGVGRLLGILSLQALPRRATLDFRDVFSDGFVFDSITGNVAVSNGVMRTDSIEIAGPAARVLMRGQADIAAETQDLRVTVRPTLSESVAIGAAVVNPAAGAVAYLAQKVLGDPIEKLFSYDYTVTGNWVEPIVTKVGASPLKHTEAEDRGALQVAH